MKNLFKKTMLFAAAAMAFVSCSNDDTNDVNLTPGVEVSINATTTDTEVSRSAFGDYNATDKTYPTFWSGTEKWAVCLNDTKITAEDIEYSDDKTSAHASVTFDAPEAYNGTYTLFAVSPAERYVSVSMESDYIRYRIPASQTPGEASCDAAAQVLIAQSEPAETVSGFDVAFKHAVAYIKFSFSNVAEGGNVTGVSISSEDVALAGRCVYAPSTKTFSFKDEAVYEINLTTTSTTDLWFACAPAAVQGKELTFTINTDKGKLSRPVTMPGNFEVGSVKTFTVNMTGIEYPVVENVVEWHKVTSLADITEGEYVIVHDKQGLGASVLTNALASSAGPSCVALSAKATVNNDILTNVDESIIWNFIGTNTAMKVQSYANNTLYLYTTASANNGIRINTDGSTHTWKFTMSSNGGEFSMQNNTTSRFCGIYVTDNWRSYTTVNQGNYGTTNSGTTGAYLTLYKKFSTDPAISASNIDVPAVGGEGEATYSVKNIETDDVTASTTAEWLTVVAGDGTILWEAEPNYTGAVRPAEVVLTSAGAGVSKTITVSQAADVFTVSPTEISLGADAEATAKFTVNSTYAFTLTNPAAEKLSLSTTSGEGTVEITVTALTANALTEALSLGNIVVTRTADNKTENVAVEQKAKPAEGETVTEGEAWSYTFTAKQWSANGAKTLNGLSWTLAGDGNYWGYDSTKGQHLGSGSYPYKSLTLSTTGYTGGVKTIKINTSGGSSVNATLTVTVGGTQIGSAIKISSSATDYTFTADEVLTGEIKFSYTQTSSKAIYIKSISIN